MITVVTIDNEPLALNVVQELCAQVGYLDLTAAFTGIGRALRYLEEHPTDLLLLDINMPAISGIDFYRKVPGNPMVIFTTAYSQYAADGFNLNAIDYLLKPFEPGRFRKAVEKAREYHEYLKYRGGGTPQHFYVRVDYSMLKVVIADIDYIEGEDNYIRIHFSNGKPLLVRMSISAITEKLPPAGFVRVHSYYVVATRAVTAVRGNTLFVGKTELPIGASYTGNAQRLLG